MGTKLVKSMGNVVMAANILNIDIKKLNVHQAYDKVMAILNNEESFKEAMLKVEPIESGYWRAVVLMQFFELVPASKSLSEEQVIQAANKYLEEFKSKAVA